MEVVTIISRKRILISFRRHGGHLFIALAASILPVLDVLKAAEVKPSGAEYKADGASAVQTHTDYPVKPVPFTAVRLDGFWAKRIETVRSGILKANFKRCEETGRIDNFSKAGGLMEGKFRGIPFNDSDVFKAIEGASYLLMLHPDPATHTALINSRLFICSTHIRWMLSLALLLPNL